eukprot:gene12253-25750_t
MRVFGVVAVSAILCNLNEVYCGHSRANHAAADQSEEENTALTSDSSSSSSSSYKSSDAVKFLIMGDWGTQTSSGKRRLLHDEPDSYEFLANDNQNQNNNNNNNNNNQNKNNNNNNNNNKNSGSYWSVLVAKAMATYADANPADFLIALGDNFYNNGVASTTDSLWTSLYTNVYNYDSLQIPWYAIFGNHDYGSNKGAGSLQAQIDFGVYKFDNRWNAGHCYMNSYTVPNSETTVDIVYIDSTLIAPEETYMTSTASGVSSDTQKELQQEQLACMTSYLANSKASFLIVAGHYPLFSTGKNSPGDMTSMVEAVLPLFEKYQVDMYFAGHDHRLEYLEYTTSSGRTMDFVISGAGGKPDNQLTSGISSAADSKFAAATGGFAFAEVSSTSINIKMVDYTGAVLYEAEKAQDRVAYTNATDPYLGTGDYYNNEKDNQNDQNQNNNQNNNQNVEKNQNQNEKQEEFNQNQNTNQNSKVVNSADNENNQKQSAGTFFSGDLNPFEVAKYGLMFGSMMALVVLVFLAGTSGNSRSPMVIVLPSDVEAGHDGTGKRKTAISFQKPAPGNSAEPSGPSGPLVGIPVSTASNVASPSVLVRPPATATAGNALGDGSGPIVSRSAQPISKRIMERKDRALNSTSSSRHPILQHRNLHATMNVSSRGMNVSTRNVTRASSTGAKANTVLTGL